MNRNRLPFGVRPQRSTIVLGLAVSAMLLAACADPQQPAISPAAGSAPVASSPTTTDASPAATGSSTSVPSWVVVPSNFNTTPDQHRVTASLDAAAAAELPAAIKASGKLVVGGGFAGGGTPPLGFTADDDKTPIGAEIDLSYLIADKLGLKPELQITSWENLFIGVDSGKYQIAVSNVGVSEERKEKYDFATYRLGLHAFEAKNGSGLEITGPADAAGKTVAVGSGTLQEGVLLNWDAQDKAAGRPGINIKYYSSPTETYLALASGRIDLYLGPNPTAVYHVATAHQTEIVGTVSSSYPIPGKVAVMTKKNNGLVKPIADAINRAIADGSYAKVLARWGLGAEAVKHSEINPAGLPKPTTTG